MTSVDMFASFKVETSDSSGHIALVCSRCGRWEWRSSDGPASGGSSKVSLLNLMGEASLHRMWCKIEEE